MHALRITWQRRLDSHISGSFLLSCNVVDRTFSVCRLPFVQANLFHTVIFNFYTKYERQNCQNCQKMRLLSTTVYFWDSNEQCLVYMFTLAD